MRRIPILYLFIILVLGTGIGLRLYDAPFIAFSQGDIKGAIDGLRQKSKRGNGYAAFLIGQAFLGSDLGSPNLAEAETWFLTAAQNGEPRAINKFLRIVMQVRQPALAATDCATILDLLDLAARTGEPNALATLGDYALSGTCQAPDLERAAAYYRTAVHLDGRYGSLLERLPPLPDTVVVHPLPEHFDVTPKEALAHFLTMAPQLVSAH